MLRGADLWGRGWGCRAGLGAQEVSGPKDTRACKRPQGRHRGHVGAERGGPTAKGARLAQRIPPGRTPAANPGQGAHPARHARGWRGRAPGGGSPSSSDVYR